MSAINLIPSDLLERKESRRRLRRWGWRLGIQICLLALVYGGSYLLAASRDAEAKRITGDYTKLLDRFRGAQALLEERNRLEQRREVIRLIQDEAPVTRHLQELGRCLTSRSYFHLVEFRKEPAPPGEDRGGEFVLRGQAPDHGELGEILRFLSVGAGFENVQLVSAQEGTGEVGEHWITFQIQLRLKEGEPDA